MKDVYFMVSELDITFVSEDIAVVKAVTKEIDHDKNVTSEIEGEAILMKN